MAEFAMPNVLAVLLFVALFTYAIAQSCPSALSSQTGVESFVEPVHGNTISVSICGYVKGGCATPGGQQICTGDACCSVCQQWNVGQTNPGAACLGKFLSSEISGSAVVVHYDQGDPVAGPDPPAGPRKATVRLTCGSSPWSDPLFIDAVHKPSDDAYIYEVDAKSSFVCSLVGISGGTIFLIILLVLVVVYIIGGIIFNKAIKKEDGIGFPHIEFWKDSPFMAKDGVMFLASKVTGGRVGYADVPAST
jgi:hypothetical protein